MYGDTDMGIQYWQAVAMVTEGQGIPEHNVLKIKIARHLRRAIQITVTTVLFPMER
jgi:hypothetical protein